MYLRYGPSVLEPAPGRTKADRPGIAVGVEQTKRCFENIWYIWRGLNCELKYSITFVIISFQISAVVVIHN